MATIKESKVSRLMECIKDTSNKVSMYKTEMEAAFREYDDEDMDLSKLDKLRDAIVDQENILRSSREAIDKQCINQLRRSKAGRENIGSFNSL